MTLSNKDIEQMMNAPIKNKTDEGMWETICITCQNCGEVYSLVHQIRYDKMRNKKIIDWYCPYCGKEL